MSRSLKKPPFVHYKLMKRVDDAQASSSKAVIKTWSRASTISPEFVGLTFAVHNGNKFIPVFVTEGSAIIAFPPCDSEAPRMKSICPPTPEYML